MTWLLKAVFLGLGCSHPSPCAHKASSASFFPVFKVEHRTWAPGRGCFQPEHRAAGRPCMHSVCSTAEALQLPGRPSSFELSLAARYKFRSLSISRSYILMTSFGLFLWPSVHTTKSLLDTSVKSTDPKRNSLPQLSRISHGAAEEGRASFSSIHLARICSFGGLPPHL